MRASEQRGIVYTEHMSVVTASAIEAKASGSGRTGRVSAAACGNLQIHPRVDGDPLKGRLQQEIDQCLSSQCLSNTDGLYQSLRSDCVCMRARARVCVCVSNVIHQSYSWPLSCQHVRL